VRGETEKAAVPIPKMGRTGKVNLSKGKPHAHHRGFNKFKGGKI